MKGRADPTIPAPIDVEGFAAFGVQVKPRKQDTPVFDVWDINAKALELFLAVQSQWRILAVGGLSGALVWQGLDYSAVDVVMRRRKLDDDLLDDVMSMEDAALAAFAEATR